MKHLIKMEYLWSLACIVFLGLIVLMELEDIRLKDAQERRRYCYTIITEDNSTIEIQSKFHIRLKENSIVQVYLEPNVSILIKDVKEYYYVECGNTTMEEN